MPRWSREQHGISSSWHLIASPLGTIDAPTFNFTRPIGSAIPEPLGFATVNFDPRSLDAYAWKVDEPPTVEHTRQIEYPSVNREHKGDRLPASNMTPAPQPVSAPSAPAAAPIAAPPPVAADMQHAEDVAAPLAVQMDVHNDASVAIAPPAGIAAADAAADTPPESTAPGESDDAVAPPDQMSFLGDDAGDRSTAVYFGTGVMGAPEGLQSWAPGAEPILVGAGRGLRAKTCRARRRRLQRRRAAARRSWARTTACCKLQRSASHSPASRACTPRSVSPRRFISKRAASHMKGQQAVAQVVMNRVFSGFYPHDVCGVVYQNAEHHLACQFTFACEGKDLYRIEEPDMWEQAKRIANDELDGKFWLADVGHATHYHAYWVHPSWVHEMVRLYQFGVHTFYRPRNWGDGDDDPVWGKAGPAMVGVRLDPEVLSENPEPAPKESGRAEEARKLRQRRAPAADKSVATAKL